MKRIGKGLFFIALISWVFMACALTQTSSIESVLQNTDLKELRAFVKENPDLPKIGLVIQRIKDLETIADLRKRLDESHSVLNENKNPDEALFQRLMEIEKGTNKGGDLEVINQLLAPNPSASAVLLKIVNHSHCNMVLNVQGRSLMQIPIPANGTGIRLVPKGSYELSGNLCRAKYLSKKEIDQNIVVSLRL